MPPAICVGDDELFTGLVAFKDEPVACCRFRAAEQITVLTGWYHRLCVPSLVGPMDTRTGGCTFGQIFATPGW